jgi:hypothetical protein
MLDIPFNLNINLVNTYLKKNYVVKKSAQKNTFFLRLCDGTPTNFGGMTARGQAVIFQNDKKRFFIRTKCSKFECSPCIDRAH